MCVKLPSEELNPSSYPPHPTSTYTYGVTIALMVRGGIPTINIFLNKQTFYMHVTIMKIKNHKK